MRFIAIFIVVFCALINPVQALDVKIESYALTGIRGADGVHQGALVLSFSPGWKTYFRHPGDSGLAPEFDISHSQNVSGIEFFWPRPEIEDLDGIKSLVFEGELVLPFALIAKYREDVQLDLRGTIGVCKNVCIPWEFKVLATLPATGGEIPEQMRRAIDRIIPVVDGPKEMRASCNLTPKSGFLNLELTFAGQNFRQTPYAVLESKDPNHVIFDVHSRPGALHQISAKIADAQGRGLVFSRKDLFVTLVGPDAAVSFVGCD